MSPVLEAAASRKLVTPLRVIVDVAGVVGVLGVVVVGVDGVVVGVGVGVVVCWSA